MGASFGSQASFITSSPQPCLKVQGKCRHPVGWRGKHCLMGTYYPCLLAPSEMAGQDGVIISHNVLCRGPGLDVWNKMLAQPPRYTSQESPVYPVKFAFVFRSRFLVLTSSASARLVFLGVCKAVAFPLFILRRTLVQRSGTSLTSHSTALGLLQPSQQLARLEHCTAGARPAVGLCSIAFDPCELSQKWESFFLGNGHHL